MIVLWLKFNIEIYKKMVAHQEKESHVWRESRKFCCIVQLRE